MAQARPANQNKRTSTPDERRRFLAIGLVLFAFLNFAAVDTSAKWLVLAGLPTGEVVFSRYAVQAILVLAFFVPRFGPKVFKSGNMTLEIVRALLLLASTVLNFIAVRYLPLTVTATVMFTLPLMICALSVPLLNETVGWRRWAAIAVGFLGVLIIIQPGTAAFHWAMIFSLGATLATAFYSIATRKLAHVDSAFTQQIYSAVIATMCIAPFTLGEWVWPTDERAWIAFLAMGLFAGIGHLALTVAHRFAEASTLAPFVYPHILYMTASSWLVFGQPPTVWILLGAPIVIGSGLYVWMREKQLVAKATPIASDQAGGH